MLDRLSESLDEALAAFNDQTPTHLNCAQAVVFFAARALEKETNFVALANYMGGGGAGMGQMCGALSGALLGLGLRDYLRAEARPDDIPASKAFLQGLISDFEAEFGTVTCRQLTGHDIRTKEGYARFKQDPISDRCADYVTWVCSRLGPVL